MRTPIELLLYGAFTFSATPPFEMTSYTPSPIIAEGFYTQSNREKRVIIPGGFVVSDPHIYVAYGKDCTSGNEHSSVARQLH